MTPAEICYRNRFGDQLRITGCFIREGDDYRIFLFSDNKFIDTTRDRVESVKTINLNA